MPFKMRLLLSDKPFDRLLNLDALSQYQKRHLKIVKAVYALIHFPCDITPSLILTVFLIKFHNLLDTTRHRKRTQSQERTQSYEAGEQSPRPCVYRVASPYHPIAILIQLFAPNATHCVLLKMHKVVVIINSEEPSTEARDSLGADHFINKAVQDVIAEYTAVGQAVPFLETLHPGPFKQLADSSAILLLFQVQLWSIAFVLMLPARCNHPEIVSGIPSILFHYHPRCAYQHQESACLRAVTKAHIADLLLDKPEGLLVSELATRSSIEGAKLARILRLLATRHCFKEFWAKERPVAIEKQKVQFIPFDFFKLKEVISTILDPLYDNVLPDAVKTHEDNTLNFDVAPEPLLPDYGLGRVGKYELDITMLNILNSLSRTLSELVELW
ncbi:hypothetical protein BT96DRAFT_989613 [Gymnopus androsaceus JB14]|uniref:Uncharacterized protein n=1 Tax=Gymnopus androsaceus JB14 TaxID=1447944 RepID=A0A6A4I2B5_9AGAR|nr:hypothetical protein BT96DRAFT_989613 [Gymnopus androsaceus JB14]